MNTLYIFSQTLISQMSSLITSICQYNKSSAAYWSKYIIFSSLQSLITQHQSIHPAYILLNVCLPCLLLQDNFGAFNKQGPTNSKYFHFSLRKFTNFVEIFWKQSSVVCVSVFEGEKQSPAQKLPSLPRLPCFLDTKNRGSCILQSL